MVIGRDVARAFLLVMLAAAAPGAGTAQQRADTSYHPPVPHPAYAAGQGPRLLFDHAHHNFHRVDANFRPFAELATRDGYRVSANDGALTREALGGADLLVIVNARGGDGPPAASDPAFTPEERAAVRDWVRDGGALLLVADHAPFGAAAEALAAEFGIGMGRGFTLDPSPQSYDGQNPSFLVFARGNGLLGDHAILRGRDTTEAVGRVVTFTGQSLSVPAGAVPLLVLSPTAVDRPPPTREPDEARAASPTSAAGRAQGVALPFGRGRVVVLGEAACLSAQIAAIPGRPTVTMGMNAPGNDDRQLTLNVLHWLSGALP
jgi:hypothetical protein